MNILIYTTNECIFCSMAKKIFIDYNLKFKEINIQKNHILFEKIIKLTKKKTVPQIFINGIFIGGYDNLIQLKKI